MEEEKQETALPVIKPNTELNLFGATNFRNMQRKFGIKIDDRRRHMYVVGKTGMGKTTLLENMVLNDIYAGHGVGIIDPHGDFAEKIIDFIPPNRINDVVYFNPADMEFPIGFNIFETVNPDHKHLIAAGLMGVFKKIWVDQWSSRMEYILNNTILALLDFPETTLLGINRLLADDEYRGRVVSNLKDPVVKAFWETEFATYNDRYKQEAVAPIQNKIGQFLSASVIRNIVAQVKSKINIREIMDSKKIFIMNLSKGRIGEDNSRLLGGMLITKIQLSAMERVDTPESERKDFFLYVDEFQNFATESFSNILSEARKYRLDLTMAHQYMEQLDEGVLAAVIGNVGSMITFRVGSTDAEILAKEFTPTFIEEDLINLTKYSIYLKLMIDGVASRPFSAITLPPIGSRTNSTEKVVEVSRERYATPRAKIEDKINSWSGLDSAGKKAAEKPQAKTFKPGGQNKGGYSAGGGNPQNRGSYAGGNNSGGNNNYNNNSSNSNHSNSSGGNNNYKPASAPAAFKKPEIRRPRPINEILAEVKQNEPSMPVVSLSSLPSRQSEVRENKWENKNTRLEEKVEEQKKPISQNTAPPPVYPPVSEKIDLGFVSNQTPIKVLKPGEEIEI